MNLSVNKNSQVLLSCMEQVMTDWAFISLDYLGEPSAQAARLPLEQMVSLQGEHCEVRLVVRGSQGLGLDLARSVRGIPKEGQDPGPVAFAEFAELLAEEWRRRELAEKGLDWKLTSMRVSSPQDWPQGAPDGAVVALARGFAVEALLWSPSGPITPV